MAKPNKKKSHVKNGSKACLKKMFKKYPDAYIPKYDDKTGLPILSREEYEDWDY